MRLTSDQSWNGCDEGIMVFWAGNNTFNGYSGNEFGGTGLTRVQTEDS